MSLNPALDLISENRLLGVWARTLRRRPDQANRMHESDAELVPLPGTDRLLALTSDTLAEEIALGFYRDPETIGWMAATMSLSDLAAVAADPLGLLVAVTLPRGAGPDFQEGLAAGLDAACRAAGTYVLGGDTNLAAEAAVTTTAVGLVGCDQVLRRTGCGAGEVVFASGPLGAGASVAARALGGEAGRGPEPAPFRPCARLREARWLVGFATACMDTSDGLIATLDQLSRLNGVGFEIATPLEQLLETGAHRACLALGLDPLLAVAQPHGEFELVWTVREEDADRFLRQAASHGFRPLALGRTIPEPVIRLVGETVRVIDAARIRNLTDEMGSEPRRYVAALSAALGREGRG
jgi:thiamine-monophosphate kinase